LYLKSLSIRGFKSFADKATLKLEPGITAIVGPNGSGKSNITDAVLWVLGEQSPRSLRGSAMEDVIFTGSSKRSPLGVADVSLCLDNADGYLPIEFSEVTIRRKMSRSGESDYFINCSSCRLLDIQDLLSDSGLGRKTHSIVSQGKIEEILNSKPEDKRFLIEEAAGVLKHRKRKERALRKLDSMDRNLLRIRDIFREVERQLLPLKKQALQAKKHQKLTCQLKDHEISLSVIKLKKMQSGWDETIKKAGYLKNELVALEKKLSNKQGEMSKIQSNLEKKGDYVGDIGEYRRRLKGIIERLNSGLLLLEEKGKHLVEKLSDLRMQIYQIERRKNNKSKELNETKARLDETKGKIDDVLNKISKAQHERGSINKNLKKAINELKAHKTDVIEKRKQLETNENKLKILLNSLSETKAEIKFTEEKLNVIENEKKSLQVSLSGKKEEENSIESRLNELKDSFDEVEKKVLDHSTKLDNLKSQFKEIEGNIFGIRKKISALEEIKRRLTGYPENVIWLIFEKSIPGLHGVIGDLLNIDEGYEKAIEAILSEDMYSIVANDVKTAREAVSTVSQSNLDIVSVIPLKGFERTFETLPKSNKLIPAMDVIRCDQEIRPAIQTLLGSVLIVDDLDIALDLADNDPKKFVYVTLNGEVVLPQGIIKGGNASSANPASRKRELAELKKDEESLMDNLRKTEEKIQKMESGLKLLTEKESSFEKKIQSANAERQIIVGDVSFFKDSITRREKEKEELMVQDERAQKKICVNKKEIKVLDTKNKLLKKEITGINDSITKAESEKEKYLIDESRFIGESAKLEAEKESLTERLSFADNQHKAILEEIKELDYTFRSEHQTVDALEKLREKIQPLHELFVVLFKKAEALDDKLKSLTVDEKADTKNLRETYKSLQSETVSLTKERDVILNKIHDIEVKSAQLQIEVRDLTGNIVNEYDIPLEKALKTYPKNLSEEECEENIKKIKKKLIGLGAINPIAVEEYSALEERYGFISNQIEDLKKSRKTLEKVIKIVEQKMKDKFLEAFNEVNVNFQNIFSYLFSGGKAQLVLTDEENLLTTGVEIEAHPLGKRLQRMTLLSGGEKSLIALTLLFAIYHTRPSPFYILDEVEPALDDANLQRFIALLIKERSNSQFLIITHQRRTMEIADCLYGVSMQADGVSKLISQKMSMAETKVS